MDDVTKRRRPTRTDKHPTKRKSVRKRRIGRVTDQPRRITETHSSWDLAVASALVDMNDGDYVTIHGDACAGSEDEEGIEVEGCTCSPWILRAGAKA